MALGPHTVFEATEGNLDTRIAVSPAYQGGNPETVAEPLVAALKAEYDVFDAAPNGEPTFDFLGILNFDPRVANMNEVFAMERNYDPETEAGSGGTGGLGTFVALFDANAPADSGAMRTIPTHEMFHLWNGGAIAGVPEPPLYNTAETIWLLEGATHYYAFEITRRTGVWDEETFWARLRVLYDIYLANPHHDQITLAEAARRLGEPNAGDPDSAYRLVYQKGPFVALLLDRQIQADTAGQKSLDDLLRTLFQKYNLQQATGEEEVWELFLTNETIMAELQELTDHNCSDFFTRWIESTEPLPPFEEMRAGIVGEIYP